MNEEMNAEPRTPLRWAAYYDSPRFEEEYVYTGTDLGSRYAEKETVWKLWSPVAQAVSLCLYATGSDTEPGAQGLGEYPMEKTEKGVWTRTLAGNYRSVYYTYRVTVDGTIREVGDPYATGAGVNGRRSMVVDSAGTNPEGWADDAYAFRERPERAFVWEVHMRDFSASPDSGMRHKGRYLAWTEQDTSVNGEGKSPTGLAYVRRLGVTHVQLLPVFDYATVDEAHPEKEYNWGYDPQNDTVPEGSYATDPYHGEVRIREFKQMVLALHQAGIGVIMDVVYNHTYETEKSVFHQVMPYYYHRLWKDGSFANGSGCGNEIASEREMVRRHILWSVLYWAKEYHIDGFRFDLMGLMDVETMNRIRRELNRIADGKTFLLYGEPWSALPPSLRPDADAADRSTVSKWEKGIGYFNEEGRDGLKGSSFDLPRRGFLTGGEGCGGAVVRMIEGGPDEERRVQYTSCHDNYTLWDKISATVPSDGSGFDAPEMIRIAVNKLAAAGVLCAKGMPFIQAGEEFGRTKYALSNSYASPVEINQLPWARTERFAELVDYYRGLAALRRKWLVPEKAEEETRTIRMADDTCIAWTIDRAHCRLFLALNAGHDYRELSMGGGCWRILADERSAGVEASRQIEADTWWIHPRSFLMAVQSKEKTED
jgi:pullulanase